MMRPRYMTRARASNSRAAAAPTAVMTGTKLANSRCAGVLNSRPPTLRVGAHDQWRVLPGDDRNDSIPVQGAPPRHRNHRRLLLVVDDARLRPSLRSAT